MEDVTVSYYLVHVPACLYLYMLYWNICQKALGT